VLCCVLVLIVFYNSVVGVLIYVFEFCFVFVICGAFAVSLCCLLLFGFYVDWYCYSRCVGCV